MNRRGTTLLELLVVIVMVALITVGATAAFSVAVDYHTRAVPERERRAARRQFERSLRDLLERAHVSTDADTFFLMGTAGAASGSTSNEAAESLTFTISGTAISGAALDSTDDFETANASLGPQGGWVEVHLSTTPYGEPGDRDGLFLREQRPADGDPTQGGTERLFFPGLASITFEGFDGFQWTELWDTTAQDEPRLPSAVRVTYTMSDDEETSYTFLVRVPRSDVTPENPLEAGGTP